MFDHKVAVVTGGAKGGITRQMIYHNDFDWTLQR